MMSNEFNLLTALHKIPWWVLAAFATLSVIDYFIVTLPFMQNLIVQGIGVSAILLLVFKGVDRGITKSKERSRSAVPKFENLSNQQMQLLMDVYRSEVRSFEVGPNIYRKRWFEKLTENNYIEYIRPFIIYFGDGNSNQTYKVTVNGWKSLERYARNSGPTSTHS